MNALTIEQLRELENLFTYHAPSGDQPDRYNAVRESAKQFAETILRCCPSSADRTAAIRKVREAVMTANASIALEAPEGT